MCFLRNQLSFFGGDYDTPALKMEDGKIILSKNKETFDTLCDDESDYYPIGVGEIADYVKKACEGINQDFYVYVTPARFFSYEDGMLCEKHFARNEEGENEGEFTLFCYDFADVGCSVDVQFTDLSIAYDMKEGSIVEMNIIDQLVNPSLGDLRESGNTYWFKHTSYLLPSVTIDVPILGDILDFIFGIFGADSPLDMLSEGLNTIIPEIPFDSRSLEEKPGFLQSMYYRCELHATNVVGEVRLTSDECEPVVLMNWNSIMTEDYTCGDEVCDVGEDTANCPTDCPPPLCLAQAPVPCDGCTYICNNEGYGTGTCMPFGEALPGSIGTWTSPPGAKCVAIISTLPSTGTCYCDTT
jgi:hypothetical protein